MIKKDHSHTLLLVDDDAAHRLVLKTLLNKWGYEVSCAADGLEAVALVREKPFDVVLMDVRMPGMDGISALKEMKKYNPSVPVVIMTAYSDIKSAVEAVKAGAYDYLIKPLDFDGLKIALERTVEHSALKVENADLRIRVPGYGIVGNSEAIGRLLEMVSTVAPSEATVLITGQSGTGKELVARAIHTQSRRNNGPWVAVNCAALSEGLLESELFGHEKGAFTGADKRRDGRFLQADKGTIFLDEIGEISPLMQVKLLRVIQQREIQRVGSDQTLHVDVRIVTATNRDLQTEVQAGRFREDLYYRLNVVTVRVPALSERRDDIPLLAQHFLTIFAQRNRKDVKGFTPLAMDMLVKHPWQGNVRELENAVERAVVLLAGDYVSERELPHTITESFACAHDSAHGQDRGAGNATEAFDEKTLDEIEKNAILHTLSTLGDNRSETAKRLGISRKTLQLKLKRYGA